MTKPIADQSLRRARNNPKFNTNSIRAALETTDESLAILPARNKEVWFLEANVQENV